MSRIQLDVSGAIARNINYFMALNKISRTNLAKRLNVTESAVGYWCTGKKIPRMDKIDSMCKIFNVDRQQIVSEHIRTIPQARIVPEDEQKLTDMFMKMNAEGRRKMIERAEELIKMGYVKGGDPL